MIPFILKVDGFVLPVIGIFKGGIEMEQLELPFGSYEERMMRKLVKIAKERGHRGIRSEADEEYFYKTFLGYAKTMNGSVRVRPESSEGSSGYFYQVDDPNRWGAD